MGSTEQLQQKSTRVTGLGNRITHQALWEEVNKALTQERGGIFNHVYLTMYWGLLAGLVLGKSCMQSVNKPGYYHKAQLPFSPAPLFPPSSSHLLPQKNKPQKEQHVQISISAALAGPSAGIGMQAARPLLKMKKPACAPACNKDEQQLTLAQTHLLWLCIPVPRRGAESCGAGSLRL